MFNGKTHYKWWFSIVMLNYQRVITVKPWKICLKCKKMRKLMKLIYNVKDLESNYIMVQKWHPFEQDLCIHFYFMFHLMVCLDVSWRVYNNSMCVQWIDSSERMRWHDGSSYTHSGFCLSELTNNNDIANWRVCFFALGFAFTSTTGISSSGVAAQCYFNAKQIQKRCLLLM